jgi:hypothetical protein
MVPMTDILDDIRAELHATEVHLRNWGVEMTPENENSMNVNKPPDALNTQQSVSAHAIYDTRMVTPRRSFDLSESRGICSKCGLTKHECICSSVQRASGNMPESYKGVPTDGVSAHDNTPSLSHKYKSIWDCS